MVNKMNIKNIIKEELTKYLQEWDSYDYDEKKTNTDVYEGDWQLLTVEIPALEKFADKENFDGEKKWFGEFLATEIANMLVEEEPQEWDKYYDKEDHVAWKKIHGLLEDFDEDNKKELSNNIKSAIESLKDLGYQS